VADPDALWALFISPQGDECFVASHRLYARFGAQAGIGEAEASGRLPPPAFSFRTQLRHVASQSSFTPLAPGCAIQKSRNLSATATGLRSGRNFRQKAVCESVATQSVGSRVPRDCFFCSLSVSVSVSLSGIAGCKQGASIVLASTKKPLSINGLRPASISLLAICKRKASSSLDASKLPSFDSLASSQSNGASALLAIGSPA